MSKGSRREREARKIYEAAGYWTYSPQNPMYGDNDLFNLFDLAAIHPLEDTFRLIQVKSNGARGIKKWVQQARHFDRVDGITVDFAVPYDREGWRLVRVNVDNGLPAGFTTVYDEREYQVPMGEGLTQFLRGDAKR